jgi:hypothetical protein
VTYDFDVEVTGWTDGFEGVAGIGGGAANNQMHLEIASRTLAGTETVATSTSWPAAGRACSLLLVYR